MSVPNRNPEIFVPGKIIQVRSPQNPLVVSKLVLVSVEEHVRHVGEMMTWIHPDASELQRAGATLHDVGKKVGARRDFLKGLHVSAEELRADFYGCGRRTVSLSPEEAGGRYVDFATAGGRRRLWPTSDGSDVRMDLDPPFGNHAADATEDDVRLYRRGALDLGQSLQGLDYVLNLVRLHHSFQPDRIIGACARHGEAIVTDLYRLIVADHTGSRWAEYVVQQLEGGLERPEREDFFGDVKVRVANEPEPRGDRAGLKVGMVRLRRGAAPGEREEPPEKELVVHYHAVEVNWDLRELAAAHWQEADGRPRTSVARARRRRRDRS